MSFINLAKSGFQNVTSNGKLIGTAKNSGIRVFERTKADGRRILTSFDKDGNAVKKVTRHWTSTNIMNTKTENFVTGAKTNSSTFKKYDNNSIVYHFEKNIPVEGSEEVIDTYFVLQKSVPNSDFESKSLKDFRKEFPELFQRKDNISEVEIYEAAVDGSTLLINSFPKSKTFNVKTDLNYKIADNFKLPDGTSKTTASTEGVLSHVTTSNVHELNVLQTLYDGLKKLWS